jgi:hypothetical protein
LTGPGGGVSRMPYAPGGATGIKKNRFRAPWTAPNTLLHGVVSDVLGARFLPHQEWRRDLSNQRSTIHQYCACHTLLLRIREVPGSHLGQNIAYRDLGF